MLIMIGYESLMTNQNDDIFHISQIWSNIFVFRLVEIKSLMAINLSMSITSDALTPPNSNQVTVVAFQLVQLTQASFLQKIERCKIVF